MIHSLSQEAVTARTSDRLGPSKRAGNLQRSGSVRLRRVGMIGVVSVVTILLAGCLGESVEAMRRSVPSEVASLMSPSWQPLYHRFDEEAGSDLWILQADVAFKPPVDLLNDGEQGEMPVEVLDQMVRKLVPDPDAIGQIRSNTSPYLGWTTDQRTYRIRQMETDRGWIYSLEAYTTENPSP